MNALASSISTPVRHRHRIPCSAGAYPGLIALLAAVLVLPAALPAADRASRDGPADEFFGLHFDFHARPIDRGIGQHTTRAMIEAIIDAARPDFTQIDCKGHFGIASYPTHVGYPAPEIVGDPLRMWREVTAERGVALYMHFSGVADDEAQTMQRPRPHLALSN